MSNAVVDSNSASANGGGIAIAVTSVTTSDISNSQLTNNIAGASGGAVYTSSANQTLQVTGSRINSNSGKLHGGGIYASGPLSLQNDTLITASQFITDTLYYSDSTFANGITMPIQATEQTTSVYVKFITSSNCELFDTIKIVTLPIVGDIGERDTIVVANTLQLTTTTPGGSWVSNDPLVATVDQSGLVTGITPGETEILYTLPDDGCGTNRTVTDTVTVLLFPLPLTLTSFSGDRQNGNDHLTWITAQEFNTSHFDIEISTDGRNFTKTGAIPAAGNSDIQRTYTFVNANVVGTIFYRLRMVDTDGRFTFSAVVRIDDSFSAGLNCVRVSSINPVPFTEAINLDIAACRQQQVQYMITDVSGRVVKMGILQIQRGNGVYLVNQLDVIRSGIYLIRGTSDNGETFTQKIMKQ